MLRVDLRAAATAPVETDTELQPSDDALAELAVVPAGPVRVSGRLMASGPGSYYWSGRVRARLEMTCRRCLSPVVLDVDDAVRLLFTEDEDNDDPAAVVIPPRAAELELGDLVREALILATPEFPVCREECRGLCPRCGANRNVAPCQCAPEPDARWAALQALQPRPDDDDTR